MKQSEYILLLNNWREQATAEALEWHGSNPAINKERLPDFAAGFNDGWRQCIRTLRLHGHLNVNR